MDYAVDYWIDFWSDFLTALNQMEVSDGISLLGLLIGFIVIITILAFIFSQRKGASK